MKRTLIIVLCICFLASAKAQETSAKFPDELKRAMADSVRNAAAHAWKGYMDHAKGYDDLRPLTLAGRNWYSHSLLMTPVDAFDSFVFMALDKEVKESAGLILNTLNFDVDMEVQVFEITIRQLGALITAYELTNNPKFLSLAKDLGTRLLPAFNTKTGLPVRYVNLKTGALRDSINNPAEIGTLFLEFGKLSQLTKDPVYYNKAYKAIMGVYTRKSKIGLVGERIDVISGKWVGEDAHISGYIDSYYEYLYKGALLFHDNNLMKAFRVHEKAIKKYLVVPTAHGNFMQQVNMFTGKRTGTLYGALDAFYAGLAAFAGDVPLAEKIQEANYYMWTKFNLEPESFDFMKDSVTSAYYILRPENLESCFYLYRLTHNDKYLWMGKRMVDDILRNCRTDAAFASLRNVVKKEQMNSMESFFFAETLKYAYLLFAPESTLDLKKYVFNTEAHPFLIKPSK